MLTCRETANSVASDELATAGWRRRWQVRLHLLMCRHCRAYTAQIRALGEAARDLLGESAGLSRPDSATLERVESEVLKHLDEMTQSPATEQEEDSV